MLDAKEMEFNYMTAACQILLGLGPAGHLIVVQEGFKIPEGILNNVCR